MVTRMCNGKCEPGEGFSYYPPSVQQILPSPTNAEGQAIEILGSDFGLTSSDVNITMEAKRAWMRVYR
jgi:hypothetical protein